MPLEISAGIDARDTSSLYLDIAGGQMYWAAKESDAILRANLDGSDPEILVKNLNVTAGIALDVARGQMYWADNGGGDIRRANLDGTGQQILLTGLPGPAGFALDLGA